MASSEDNAFNPFATGGEPKEPPSGGLLSDADREALVQALLNPRPAKRVASKAKRLTSSHPSEDERREIFFGLLQMPDMATAMLGVAYLERQLEELLREAFVQLSKEDDTRIFDGRSGGILGGFAAKIRIAHALGYLGAQSYSDLMLMNDIRNAFAHSLHVVDFNHEDIAEDCRALQRVGLDPDLDWSEYEPNQVNRARFFWSVVNLYTEILRLQVGTLIRRKDGSLASFILRELKIRPLP